MDIESKYIIEISKGDRAAFDALFMLYYPKVKNFVFGFVKNEDDAFDLSQDVFLKIWNNRSRLPEITHFKTYLFQIAKNTVYDFFRRKVLFDDYSMKESLNREQFDLPHEAIEAEELELLIYGLIDSMPEQRRQIFKMSRVEGLSNDEIASKMNISKRTVETHISNVLKEIRKALTSIVLFFL